MQWAGDGARVAADAVTKAGGEGRLSGYLSAGYVGDEITSDACGLWVVRAVYRYSHIAFG